MSVGVEGIKGKGGSFKIGRPRSRGWKHFRCRWTWGVGVFEN